MEEKLFVNSNECTVIKLLGKGKGGYSYLVQRDVRTIFDMEKNDIEVAP